MTFEQLRIFIAVAEREHLTRAAEAIGLTASAVSSSIKNLEAFYNVELFHRVGRNIELTESGRVFLGEARATLARVRNAELILSEMGGLTRGEITVCASQTIASYWLPPILMQFKKLYPGVTLKLDIGNTKTVTQAVLDGLAEVGFIEGRIDEPALVVQPVVSDKLLVVTGSAIPSLTVGISPLSICSTEHPGCCASRAPEPAPPLRRRCGRWAWTRLNCLSCSNCHPTRRW